jgi:hypothetical protein
MGVKEAGAALQAFPHERERVHQCAHLVLVNTSWQFGTALAAPRCEISMIASRSSTKVARPGASRRPLIDLRSSLRSLHWRRGYGSGLRFHTIGV